MIINHYIDAQTPHVQAILLRLRQLVAINVPDAEEYLGYGMIGYKSNQKPLIYFGVFKNHLGVYPTPSGISAFKSALSKYRGAKGSVQFPWAEEIPYELIKKIIQYRYKENYLK